MELVELKEYLLADSGKEGKEKIRVLEEVLLDSPQVDIPVNHTLHGGLYARQIVIPAGTVLTGMVYLFNHLDIMIDGDITISTDTGEVQRLTGFNLLKGHPGKKRAGYAHQDTTWVTIHAIEGKDGEDLQKLISRESAEEAKQAINDINRQDYYDLLDEFGYTQEEVDAEVKMMNVTLDHPDFLFVLDSDLHGQGVFTLRRIEEGETICLTVNDEGERSIAGRYTNHAFAPNCEIDENWQLKALRDIPEGEELLINYRPLLQRRRELCQQSIQQ